MCGTGNVGLPEAVGVAEADGVGVDETDDVGVSETVGVGVADAISDDDALLVVGSVRGV